MAIQLQDALWGKIIIHHLFIENPIEEFELHLKSIRLVNKKFHEITAQIFKNFGLFILNHSAVLGLEQMIQLNINELKDCKLALQEETKEILKLRNHFKISETARDEANKTLIKINIELEICKNKLKNEKIKIHKKEKINQRLSVLNKNKSMQQNVITETKESFIFIHKQMLQHSENYEKLKTKSIKLSPQITKLQSRMTLFYNERTRRWASVNQLENTPFYNVFFKNPNALAALFFWATIDLENLDQSVQNKMPVMQIVWTHCFPVMYKGDPKEVFNYHRVKVIDLETWQGREEDIPSLK